MLSLAQKKRLWRIMFQKQVVEAVGHCICKNYNYKVGWSQSVPIGQQDNIWWVLGFLCFIGRQRLGLPIRDYEMQWLKTLFLDTYRVPHIATQQFASFIVFFSMTWDFSPFRCIARGNPTPRISWSLDGYPVGGGARWIIICNHHTSKWSVIIMVRFVTAITAGSSVKFLPAV